MCQGLSFICSRTFRAPAFPELRYLDATGTGMDVAQFNSHFLLAYLRLANCDIDMLSVPSLPNLLVLDLSWNKLTQINTYDLR